MPNREEIWVLGNKSTVADKAFGWNEDIPNITDADVVVLDLSTLHKLEPTKQLTHTMVDRKHISSAIELDQRIAKLHRSVTRYLEEKILGGGHIVYLLHYNEVFDRIYKLNIMPFDIEIINVAERTKIYYPDHRFKDYLNNVQSVNYDLKISDDIDATNQFDARLKLKNNSLVTDKLEKIVGSSYDVIRNRKPCGQLTFLPSITPSTNSEMIDAIILELKGDIQPSPPWANNLKITGMNEIKDDIAKLESKKAEIEEQISKLKSKKESLSSHSKLLYATGKPLEKAVKTAFSMLGFTEIAQVREKDKEDWRIDSKSVPKFDIGTMEIKGVVKRTGKEDIVQCDTWARDYPLMDLDIKAKGIFIPNQHRLSEFPQSKKKRRHFEPNELEFAKTRKICIIPSYVLFESINKVLNGKTPDRSKIEQLIFNTNGVLESIL